MKSHDFVYRSQQKESLSTHSGSHQSAYTGSYTHYNDISEGYRPSRHEYVDSYHLSQSSRLRPMLYPAK